jgi:hypothetical protein
MAVECTIDWGTTSIITTNLFFSFGFIRRIKQKQASNIVRDMTVVVGYDDGLEMMSGIGYWSLLAHQLAFFNVRIQKSAGLGN